MSGILPHGTQYPTDADRKATFMAALTAAMTDVMVAETKRAATDNATGTKPQPVTALTKPTETPKEVIALIASNCTPIEVTP